MPPAKVPSLLRPRSPVSLLTFHRALIVAAIVFCFGFAIYQVLGTSPGAGSPWIAVTFSAIGLGFVVYLLRMQQVLGYGRDPGTPAEPRG